MVITYKIQRDANKSTDRATKKATQRLINEGIDPFSNLSITHKMIECTKTKGQRTE